MGWYFFICGLIKSFLDQIRSTNCSVPQKMFQYRSQCHDVCSCSIHLEFFNSYIFCLLCTALNRTADMRVSLWRRIMFWLVLTMLVIWLIWTKFHSVLTVKADWWSFKRCNSYSALSKSFLSFSFFMTFSSLELWKSFLSFFFSLKQHYAYDSSDTSWCSSSFCLPGACLSHVEVLSVNVTIQGIHHPKAFKMLYL